MTEQIQPNDRVRMVRGRVKESIRLAKRSRNLQKPKVIAYFRYVFTDTKKYLSEVSLTYNFLEYFDLIFNKKKIVYICLQKDTYEALNMVKNIGGDGVVLWGSSFDLNTK